MRVRLDYREHEKPRWRRLLLGAGIAILLVGALLLAAFLIYYLFDSPSAVF